MSEIIQDTNVNFNFSFGSEVSDAQILGFEIAGDIWSQHLADSYQGQDLEINIYVETTNDLLPDDVVGGSFPTIETGIKYNDIYDAIQNDITTDADVIVADNLLDQNKINSLVGGEVIDKNFKTHVTTANMKALGMKAGDSDELDGYILINDFGGQNLWNYNYLDAPAEGQLDFLSMAQHEIGHVLGFISGAKHTEETVDNRITDMTTMDLFRYSTDSLELGINDLTYGVTAFFSIDGEESIIELTTGIDHQVGHLEVSSDPDHDHALMSPSISLAERWSITGSDLLVLDAIGWDVVNPGTIDMSAIYANAEARLEFAQIGDRRDDVEQFILSGDAYNWGSGGSTSTGTGWWWGSGGSTSTGTGWWQQGYFMEIETTHNQETGETEHHTHESGSEKFWHTVEIIVNWLKYNWWNTDSDSDYSWWNTDSDSDYSWWNTDSDPDYSWWNNDSDTGSDYNWW